MLLPLRQSERYTVERQQAVLADPKATRAARIEAAEYLAFARRIDEPIVLSSLAIGDVHLVHLPGEAFVEYQLFAQSVLPGRFVAVAAFGEYDPVYICTAKAFDEGGYEPTEAMSGPGSEAVASEGHPPPARSSDAMTKGKHGSRKTARTVRTPATKFSHLQKKARPIRDQTAASRKAPKGRG